MKLDVSVLSAMLFLEILFFLADRVFGPTTTTRHVYDVAAQHVVNGAMAGINGMDLTLFIGQSS